MPTSAHIADLDHRFTAMGSPCEMRLQSAAAGGENILQALQQTLLEDILRLELRYSRYRDDSLISAINRVAERGGSIDVDAETAGLLDYAHTCYQQSDGLFDITSGLLRQAWRFDGSDRDNSIAVPAPEKLAALLPRIGWHRLCWQAPRLDFPEPGLALDLGGIVKEYAVDRAAGLCRAAGIRHGYLNLGGDLHVLGPQIDGRPWRIGISHPRQPGELLTTLTLQQGALASSGDYERCHLIDGVRYSHILNPCTGWPVQGLAAVTVLAPLCVIAGSAATIAMLKENDGPAWLEALGLPHCWVDLTGKTGGNLPAEYRGNMSHRSI